MAGETVDLVVETSWEKLGAIVTDGAALPLRGEPRPIAGHARDRYVYAPVGGTFRTRAGIGDRVREGEIVASIEHTRLAAPLDGVLRGLTHDGVVVARGTKIVGDRHPGLARGLEVDPVVTGAGQLHEL